MVRHQVTLFVKSSFSASHTLRSLSPGHKCGNLHGHNYHVRLGVTGTPSDDLGIVLEFDYLNRVLTEVMSRYDHKDLNQILNSDMPTVEVVAADVLDSVAVFFRTGLSYPDLSRISELSIEVHETEGCSALIRWPWTNGHHDLPLEEAIGED